MHISSTAGIKSGCLLTIVYCPAIWSTVPRVWIHNEDLTYTSSIGVGTWKSSHMLNTLLSTWTLNFLWSEIYSANGVPLGKPNIALVSCAACGGSCPPATFSRSQQGWAYQGVLLRRIRILCNYLLPVLCPWCIHIPASAQKSVTSYEPS